MEYETFSWKERCNRYFSSISDTAKDGDQEKDTRPEGEDTGKEIMEDISKDIDNESKWKDLGEIKKKVVVGKLSKYVRKVMNSLDIHGARFAGKSRNSAELVMWILITIVAVAALFVLIFFTVREYRKAKESFTITRSSPSHHGFRAVSKPAVSICNLNLLRNHLVDGTRFSYLRYLEEDKPIVVHNSGDVSLEGLVSANSKLMHIINGDPDLQLSVIVKELGTDIEVMEVLKDSNLSVDQRLVQAGFWDIVRSRVRPTVDEVERFGHQIEEMLIDCRVGYRQCKKSEIQPVPDVKHGNCFKIIPEEITESVVVFLDAQSEEYLHTVSPSVGFHVSTHNARDDLNSGETVLTGASLHTEIKVLQEQVTERDSQCTNSYRSRKCYEDCLEDHTLELCGCREKTDEPGEACNHGNTTQYICLKVTDLLRTKGKMACSCLENCRDTHVTVGSSSIKWPSEYNMDRMGTWLLKHGKQMNATQIRNNLVKVTVRLQPDIQETIQQSSNKSVLELLAQIGGLSALVVGLSAVTLVELLWTLIRISVDFINYLCKRSNNKGSLQRLTDSEITSITWAIYRQKRRQEEMNKESEKAANQRRSQTTIGGNVPSRLHRRNSNGSKIYDDLDQFELRKPNGEVGNGERSNDKFRSTHLNNNIKAERNGYRKHGNNNNRLHSISEEKREGTKHSEGVRAISENPYYSGSIQSNGHLGSDGDPRYRAQYAQRVPYIHPASVEGVRLYGGSAAYFYTNPEPTYL